MRVVTFKIPFKSGLLHVNDTVTGLSTTSASVANPCRETTVPVMADPSVPVWPSKERDRMGEGTVGKSEHICSLHKAHGGKHIHVIERSSPLCTT